MAARARRRGPMYDTVYAWDPTTSEWYEVPRWNWPDGADAHAVARLVGAKGHVAHPGNANIGPPEGPPR